MRVQCGTLSVLGSLAKWKEIFDNFTLKYASSHCIIVFVQCLIHTEWTFDNAGINMHHTNCIIVHVLA